MLVNNNKMGNVKKRKNSRKNGRNCDVIAVGSSLFICSAQNLVSRALESSLGPAAVIEGSLLVHLQVVHMFDRNK